MAKTTTPDLKTMLKPRDRSILDAQAGTNWVPQDPRELILPYMPEQDEEVDRNSIDFRRTQAKEIYDGYGKIIDDCKKLEEEIVAQSKNVTITLNPSTQLRIIEAVRRVFPGSDGKTITFEMYQKCIQALAATSEANIPKP